MARAVGAAGQARGPQCLEGGRPLGWWRRRAHRRRRRESGGRVLALLAFFVESYSPVGTRGGRWCRCVRRRGTVPRPEAAFHPAHVAGALLVVRLAMTTLVLARGAALAARVVVWAWRPSRSPLGRRTCLPVEVHDVVFIGRQRWQHATWLDWLALPSPPFRLVIRHLVVVCLVASFCAGRLRRAQECMDGRGDCLGGEGTHDDLALFVVERQVSPRRPPCRLCSSTF